MQEEVQKIINIKKIDRFQIRLDKQIGSGSYSKVYRAFDEQDLQSQLCCKIICIEKTKHNQNAFKNIKREVETLKILKQYYLPNIIQLIDCFITKNNVYLFLELCTGGSLGDQISKKRIFTEVEVLNLIQQIAKTFCILQENKIIHRDLKPDNIMIQNQNIYKIADFGFARVLENIDEQTKVTCVGSPLYMSPQLLLNSETKSGKCDIWSLGCIAYEMLYGQCPFETSDMKELIQNLKSKEIVFPQTKPIRSKKLTDLIGKMLEKDEDKRISWNEILNDEIFKYDTMKLKLNESFINQILQNYNLSCSTKILPQDLDLMYQNTFMTLSKIEGKIENSNKKMSADQIEIELDSDTDLEIPNERDGDEEKKQFPQETKQQMMTNTQLDTVDQTMAKNSIIQNVFNFLQYKRNIYCFYNETSTKLHDYLYWGPNKINLLDKFKNLIFLLQYQSILKIYEFSQILLSRITCESISQNEWKLFYEHSLRNVLIKVTDTDMNSSYEILQNKYSQYNFEEITKQKLEDKQFQNFQFYELKKEIQNLLSHLIKHWQLSEEQLLTGEANLNQIDQQSLIVAIYLLICFDIEKHLPFSIYHEYFSFYQLFQEYDSIKTKEQLFKEFCEKYGQLKQQ